MASTFILVGFIAPAKADDTPPVFTGTKCTFSDGSKHWAEVVGRIVDDDSGVVEWELEGNWGSLLVPAWVPLGIGESAISPPDTDRAINRKGEITDEVTNRGGKPVSYRIRVKDASGKEMHYDPVAYDCPVDFASGGAVPAFGVMGMSATALLLAFGAPTLLRSRRRSR